MTETNLITPSYRRRRREFGIHHHRQRALPHVLYVRAGVPGQGDSHHRRPGPGHRRALHRLRELRADLFATRQDSPQQHRRSAGVAAIAVPRWRHVWRPVFPPNLRTLPYTQLVGMIRSLGFRFVVEVSFGADLVAREYRKLLNERNGHRYISTTCPAVVGYVERYYPDIVDSLGPDRFADGGHGAGASPLARRRPEESCSSALASPKKSRPSARQLAGEVDAVLMFPELRRMFADDGIFSRRRRCAQRLRSSPRRTRRPVSGQPRHFAGGRHSGRPADRRSHCHARPQPHARSDQGVRRGRSGVQTPGSPVLRRLHHGAGHQRRFAAVQSAAPRPHLRLPPHGATGSGRVATLHGSACRSRSAPHLSRRRSAHSHARPDRIDGHHASDGQVYAGRRVELRRLRLRHLRGTRRGHPQEAGRKRDVPAEHDRPAPHRLDGT